MQNAAVSVAVIAPYRATLQSVVGDEKESLNEPLSCLKAGVRYALENAIDRTSISNMAHLVCPFSTAPPNANDNDYSTSSENGAGACSTGNDPDAAAPAAVSSQMTKLVPTAVALPLIGAGVLGFSEPLCARVCVQAVYDLIQERAADKDRALSVPSTFIFVEPAGGSSIYTNEVAARFPTTQSLSLPSDETAAASAPLSAADEDSAENNKSTWKCTWEAPPELDESELKRLGGVLSSEVFGNGGSAVVKEPPKDETPAQRRARMRAEAEERLKLRLAMEQGKLLQNEK